MARKPPAVDEAARALLDPDDAFPDRLALDLDTLRRLAEGLWTLPRGEAEPSFAAIERLAHGLAGAAGTFGYGRIGEAALRLEGLMAARHAVRDAAAWQAGTRRRIDGLVHALEDVSGNAGRSRHAV